MEPITPPGVSPPEFAHSRFDVVDLDDGIPDGPAADVILCYWFHDPSLDEQILNRLAPAGLLAITMQEPSTVDKTPGGLPPYPHVSLGVSTAGYQRLEDS